MAELIDITGQVFSRWTIICRAPADKHRHTMWLCRCTCGTERAICGLNLKRGATRSCGCLEHELRQEQKGEKSSSWRGGRTIGSRGYPLLHKAGHPNANKAGYVLEHVYVMSQIIGRPLIKGETVHHKNGVKLDSSPENLELWAGNHSYGQRVSDLVPWAIELLQRYKPELLK